jgi:methyl-accepting chemotaxis protein
MKETMDMNLMTEKEEEEYLLKLTKQYPDYINIYYGTKEGKMINGMGFEYPASYDPRKRPWYSQGMKEGENLIMSEPYIDAAVNSYVVSGIVQLRDENNNVRAIMAGDILLEPISKQIKNISLDKNKKAFIIDMNTGKVIADSSSDDNGGKNLSKISKSFEKVEKELMKNKKGIMVYEGENGREYLAYHYIDGLNWNFALSISEKAVLSKISVFKKVMTTIMIISIIILIILLERIANSITGPIKMLLANIEEISNGNLKTRISIKGNDEISILAKSINSFPHCQVKCNVSPQNTSNGVNQPKHFFGIKFINIITSSTSLSVNLEKSVPFGSIFSKYRWFVRLFLVPMNDRDLQSNLAFLKLLHTL